LTGDGYEYVLDALRDGSGDSDVLREWRDYYGSDRMPGDLDWLINDILDNPPNPVRDSYPDYEGSDCGDKIPVDVKAGDACANCGHVFVAPTPDDNG